MESNFSDVLSLAATITTILMFLTGSQVIFKIIRKQSSQGLLVLPFMTCFVSCTFWTKYGMLTNDKTMIYVNLTGSIFESIYAAVFYVYTKNKRTVLPTIVWLLLFLFSVLAYTKYVTVSGPIAISHHGLVCAAFNIINFAAPLAAAVSVIKQKSTENLSFPLSLVYFLVALEWYLYGYMRDDPFIKIPNLIGIFLGGFQLSLFLFFSSKTTRKFVKQVNSNHEATVLVT